MGLDRQADWLTGPHNVLGIELNEYAAELARVTVWIGELQWRIEHGYDFKDQPGALAAGPYSVSDALLSFRVARLSTPGRGRGRRRGPHGLRVLKTARHPPYPRPGAT